MTRRTPAVALACTVALLASGCGGKSADKQADTQWAESVCSSLGEWQDAVDKSVNNVQAQIQSPSTGAVASINTEVQSALDATKKLSSELKSLDPPSSDAGRQAKQQLVSLSTKLDQTVTKTKQAVAGIPAGAAIQVIATRLTPLVPSLQTLATSASTTLSSIRSGGLKDAFDGADSCKRFA